MIPPDQTMDAMAQSLVEGGNELVIKRAIFGVLDV